ncbi:MAG: phosphate ABC transporter ATP-binding protein PstB [Fervidicoccaceae archaeon]|jgi:phosphate transport system ATP-binding protein
MSDYKIIVENVSAGYNSNIVLRNINLKIPQRKITAIMGPSGSGKSTFLRILNRLHELTPGAWVKGRVILDGIDIYDRKVNPTLIRKKIGMVFQKPNPFPMMSIYDNVAIGLKLNGIKDKKTLDEIVRRSLEIVGLWDEVKGDLHRPGTMLSGGQQQRLCIARALAVNPEVILMDEPTSSLDPISSMTIESLVKKLAEDRTIVIVTHNVQQAIRLADYVAFFYLGELIEHGPAVEVFTNPKHELTLKFVKGTIG